MRFRPFSVKKFRFFTDFADFWTDFSDFFAHLLIRDLLSPLKPPIPHGSPHYRFLYEIGKKIGFPMPTAKNGFHILNLLPKNVYKIPFFNANLIEQFPKLFLYILFLYAEIFFISNRYLSVDRFQF